nr:hypothetical protein [Tanacetum cinerariifolium]
MDMTIDQQVALDEALVPHASRLRIGKGNFRFRSNITSKESTIQATATAHHHSIRFKMKNKKRIVNLEYFREMLHICPRIPNQTSDELPFEEEILALLRYLGHNVPEIYMQEFWATATVHHNSIRFKMDNRKRIVNLEYFREIDDQMFTTIKLVSRHQNTQQFGVMFPIELTNEEIRNSKAYKEYYVVASGAAPPKTKDDDDQDEGDDDDDQDEGNDDNQDTNEEVKKGQDAEDDEDELYKDVNINLEGRVVQMADVHTTQEFEDTHVTLTPVNPDGQQHSSMLNPTPDARIDSLFETTSQMDVQALTRVASLTLSAPTLTPSTMPTTSTVPQVPTPPTTAPSNLLQDLPNFGSLFGFDHRLKTLEANFSEFVQTNQFTGAVSSILRIVQRYMDQRMNEIVKIIKEQVKDQVKVQVSKILPKIEKTVNEQLEAEVLTRSSNSSKTSYAVTADLSEMKLKKIIIEKIEGNKEGKEPESTSAPKEKATRTTGKSIQGLKYQQKTASESAPAKELMQTTQDLEEPSHQEFATGVAADQPITEASQHPEWFQQQKKPQTPDSAWNKTLPATDGSIQPWISDLAKQADSRSSFNELMDTPVDFSAFIVNRLKVDTLTPELLAGPTYELMKGSCKSLVELKFFLEEVYKATTDQDDDKLYKFKEGDFKRLSIQEIEDMLLLLVQGKLTNLTIEERFAFNVSLRMFTRSIVMQRHVEDLQL